MHSCIERNKKNRVIFVPDQMYSIIQNAKVQGKKYNVKEMTQSDFFNFKLLVEEANNWERDVAGNKVSWSKIKQIAADPNYPGKLKFKYNFDEEEYMIDTNNHSQIPRKRKTKKNSRECTNTSMLTLTYNAPLPISRNLHKDLISLCDDNFIPPHYQTFYRNLHSHTHNLGNDSDADDSG